MSALTLCLEAFLTTGLALLGGGAEAPPAPAAKSPSAALCAGRAPCRVVSVTAAGTGAKKQALWVAEVALHDRAGDDWKQASFDECAPWEVWLLEGPEGKAKPTRKLLALCNDGYGAAMMGEDQVEVGPNRLTYTQSGGSNWRWSSKKVLQLSPLKLLEEHGDGYWTVGPNAEESRWSWAEARGTVSWGAPTCAADGSLPEVGSDEVLNPTLSYQYETLPLVTLTPAQLSAWKTVGLGTCAMRLDGRGERGRVLEGAEATATDDGTLAALMVGPNELLVEVTDDRLLTEGDAVAGRPVASDAVELHGGPQMSFSDHCLDADAPVWTHRVDLATGAVTGPVPLPRVERHVVRGPERGVVRLRVTFAEPIGGLTLVHADSDDGQAVERRVASSALIPGRAATLGGWKPLENARCTKAGGALALEPVLKVSRNEPVL